MTTTTTAHTMATKKTWRTALVFAGAALLGGCSAARPTSMAASPPSTPMDRGGAESASSFSAGTSANASPAAEAAPSGESAATPTTRAGLGTEWGETRTSRIEETRFDRANWNEPFALAMIHYNDRDGVEGASRSHRRARSESEVSVANGALSIALHGEGGSTFPALFPLGSASNGQMNVVGRAGERYTIVVTNHSNRRVEAVATVDGLDVMDGTAGSFDHRGYLVAPHGTLEIDGFRKSTSEVAAFRFGAIADSYAAQTGSARDVGVIGVALFGEKGADDDDGANPFPAESRFAKPPR